MAKRQVPKAWAPSAPADITPNSCRPSLRLRLRLTKSTQLRTRSPHSKQAAQEAPPVHEAEQDSTIQTKPRPSDHKQLLADAKDIVGQDGQALQSIALSPEVEIITVAQPATSEKSLTDFALAMGLDPSQIQALLGDAAAANVSASPAATTQQMLAMNTLPMAADVSLPTPGMTALNPLGNSMQLTEGAALPVNSVLAQPCPWRPTSAPWLPA